MADIKVAEMPNTEVAPAIEQTPTETQPVVAEQTTEQTQTQTETQPEWKPRFKSEDEMWNFARQKQSEADTYKGQLEQMQRVMQPPAPQPHQPSNEELVEQFVKDPQGFVQSMMAPIQVQVAIQDFSRSHPDFESLRAEMAAAVNRNPSILNDPEGLEMVYNHVKARKMSVASGQAAETLAVQKAETEKTKKESAWAEGSTKSQKSPALELKPGMSEAEMEAILDKKGIPVYTRDH